ncbi:MAG: hypothetical protein PHV36_06145 [Elusimicrobiales bacterium]|nr:hypothetical protein [Elusimicrobiales bacterium]
MENISIRDLAGLQQEFYRAYNPDYWLCKMQLFKNCHDNFESLKGTLKKDIDTDDAHYMRVIRTEMHFLYFQMIEALFEITFAIAEHDNRNLWLSLTISNWKDNYQKISHFSESDIFTRTTSATINGDKTIIPLLRWVFYFHCHSRMTDTEWETNLANIKRLLLVFAKDFSNRDEYNAYKHSLRFYSAPFSITMWRDNKPSMIIQNDSKDSITYLKKQKRPDSDSQAKDRLTSITKSFNFERDYHCCLLIYELISNVINTRKHAILKELDKKEFQFTIFNDSSRLNILQTGTTQVEFDA